ncbi:hypothetical protein DSECCO2_244210 [anaerobic digester metagenome]
MKKIITLLAIILVVVACNTSNESQAKKLIKEYLKTTMNDFSSYESVEFSELDSCFTLYYDSEEAKNLSEMIESEKKYNEFLSEKIESFIQRDFSNELIESFKNSYDKSQIRIDSLFQADIEAHQSFIPEFIGFEMTHKFRGKNAFGALILNEYVFLFDKDFTKVIEAINFKDTLNKLKEILDDNPLYE